MKTKNKKVYLLLLVIVISGLVVLSIKYFSPYYKIDSRIAEMKKYKGVRKEKAIGWLRVQGTNIDFPIVYYNDSNVEDPTYDLGWNYRKDDKKTKNIVLFSHNILNVSSNPIITDKEHKRFEQLMSFIYPSFVKKNKYIQYTVGGKDYLYKIYAISFVKKEKIDNIYDIDNYTVKQANKYIKEKLKQSYFKFDIDVNGKDDLLTLVTCTRFFNGSADYSFTVDARRVRKKEIVKNYGIIEKKSYNRIRKIMEGVDKDEKV